MEEELHISGSESPSRSNVRRRLLQAGLSTGPVLMTVVSRPVLGSTLCLAPSASLSPAMPTSGTHTQQICTGLTPEQWKAIPDQWPSPYVAGAPSSGVVKSLIDVSASPTEIKSTVTQRRQPSGTTQSSGTTSGTTQDAGTTDQVPREGGTLYHCPTTGFGGRVFGSRSLTDVIDMTDEGIGVYSLGRYMVAALLNACSGRTPVLDESAVRDMWNDLVNRGYYEPTAGVQWGADEIVAYLRTTMG
jgi:hypothetical protein